MKRLLTLLMTLSILTITGCVSSKGIVVPPRPEREELQPVKDLRDAASVINYYEHLVQEWEAWADTVEAQVEGK